MRPVASGIAAASLVLVLGVLGSRALGVLRNAVLASAFGAGPELDAYFAAFRLPDAIFQLLVGGTLGSAFIPTFADLLHRASPAVAWRLASTALNLFTLLGALAAGITFLLAPWLVPLTVPGFPPESQRLTVHLSQVMLLSAVFFCASGMVTGILNARFHFLLPALAPWLYNLSIIAGTLLLGEAVGVLGPAVGVSVGAALHLLVQLPGLARVGASYHPSISLKARGLGQVFRLMGPRLLGLAAVQVNWLVTTVLASTLASGSLVALSYAWAVTMLPVSILGMAPATAAFPALAQSVARDDWEGYRTTLATGLQIALFLTLPASLGLLLLREPVVALLFQRGQFDAASAGLTAWALGIYATGLVAHVALELLARGAYAMRDTRTPLFWALLGLASHLLLSLILIAPLGLGGLALSLTLAAYFETGGLFLSVARRLGRVAWGQMALDGLKTLVATAAMGFMVQGLAGLLPPDGWWLAQAGMLTVAAMAGGATFLAAAALLRSQALAMLRQQLGARQAPKVRE
ncbi:MAG: murein biosynthesis integral membrane protein MurJ [Chloroflexi bacterium]|nr:murein biosynthesis integral membrane protein MurJ [Chloroflexota bacterium]